MLISPLTNVNGFQLTNMMKVFYYHVEESEFEMVDSNFNASTEDWQKSSFLSKTEKSGGKWLKSMGGNLVWGQMAFAVFKDLCFPQEPGEME